MQSYQLPDHSNANETESGKRSLRVTDNFDLAANREIDLEEGPLLLNIGDGVAAEGNDPPQQFLDIKDLTRLPSSSTRGGPTADLEYPLQPEIHNASYAETTVQSESSHGKSFSMFTDDVLSTGKQKQDKLDVFLLSGMGDFSGLSPANNTAENLDIITSECPTIQPDPTSDLSAIFPWKFEFSWDDGQLVYGSDPLTSQAVDTLPQDRSTRTVDATASSQSTDVFDDEYSNNFSTEVPIRYSHAIEPDTVKTTAVTMKYALEQALRQGVIDELWHDFREKVISIVDDHYWRTHASQRSKNKTGASEQNNANNATKSSHHDRVTKYRGSRSRKQHKDDRDESEDGSSEDDHQRDPGWSMSRSGHDKRRVACPFFKNDPRRFSECNVKGFQRIAILKTHLLNKHNQHHCPSCFETLTIEAQFLHKCLDPLYPKEVHFLRQEALTYLRNTVPREQGSQDERISKQWMRLYKIIFPEATPPFPDPFVAPFVVTIARDLERHLKQHASILSQLLAEPHPIDAFATPAEKRLKADRAVQTWITRSINTYVDQGVYNDTDLDTTDQSQPEDNEPTAQCIDPLVEHNQKSTNEDFLDTHQLPSPSSRTLDTVGLEPHYDTNTNAFDQRLAFPIDTFPAEPGWDDTQQFINSFDKFEFDPDVTYLVNDDSDFLFAKQNELLPSSSNAASNLASGHWYPGASHHIDGEALSPTLYVSNSSGYMDFNSGFGDQDYYLG